MSQSYEELGEVLDGKERPNQMGKLNGNRLRVARLFLSDGLRRRGESPKSLRGLCSSHAAPVLGVEVDSHCGILAQLHLLVK